MPSANYPQLPKGVWHGVWALLRKTPSRKLDDRALAAELGVQSTAAKAYARELVRLNILDEEFKPTELANKWRQDGEDVAVIEEILNSCYPRELRDLAPIGDLDRDKIIRWFMNDGLGEGSAKNKTATYVTLAEGVGDDAAVPSKAPSKKRPPDSKASDSKPPASRPKAKNLEEARGGGQKFSPELAINVQIHISADASSEQIEAIFASMKKHFSK